MHALYTVSTHKSRHVHYASQLSQQETQQSLSNRATHLCKRNGVADLLETRLSPYW